MKDPKTAGILSLSLMVMVLTWANFDSHRIIKAQRAEINQQMDLLRQQDTQINQQDTQIKEMVAVMQQAVAQNVETREVLTLCRDRLAECAR